MFSIVSNIWMCLLRFIIQHAKISKHTNKENKTKLASYSESIWTQAIIITSDIDNNFQILNKTFI